jgi:hypothetical protein
MKSKFFTLLTASLATLVLVVPVPKAFGQSVESQTNLTEPQPLMFDVDMSGSATNASIQSQGKIQQSQVSERTEALPDTAALQTTQPSKPNSVEQTDKVLGGLFITLIFIYILVGLQHRRHRATVLLQQIETLERIWNMEHHR